MVELASWRDISAPECHGWDPLEAGELLEDLEVPVELLELEAGAGVSDTWSARERATSPDLLHPLLYATLTAAQQAGLPVRLLSGRRDVEHQIAIWDGRMRAARANGEDPPASWAEVEADFPRWYAWALAEAQGLHGWRKHGPGSGRDGAPKGSRYSSKPTTGTNPTTGRPWRDAPPLLWPGLSKHQAQPFALAADLEVTDAAAGKRTTLRKVEELAPEGVYRPMPQVEPWHFAVRQGYY